MEYQEGKLWKYLIISLLIHIIIIGGLLQLHIFKVFVPQHNEIELLEINDLAFPSEGASENKNLQTNQDSFDTLKDINETMFTQKVLDNPLNKKSDLITPTESHSYQLTTINKTLGIKKKDIKYTLKTENNDFNDVINELNKNLNKKNKAKKRSNYSIISKDLEGRKIIQKGQIPKNLHFSKNEKLVLSFEVTPDGNVINIVPDTITSTDKLNIAIDILNQFKWEKIKSNKIAKGKIIFYFKVE